MNKNFKTEKEAKDEADKRVAKYKPYCPLINGDCDHNCICFKPPEVYSESDREGAGWFIRGGCCGNKMLCGN